MKALDTNVLVRLLVADDALQARRARRLLEDAERSGDAFLVTTAVVLETLWVLGSVYELDREDVVHAIALLAAMPVLKFEDHDVVQEFVRRAEGSKADPADLLIGLCSRACGAEATLTFEKGLERTGLFERL